MTRPPWSDQVRAADWIVDALSDDLASVAWLVPRTFPAVGRLLHPVVQVRNGLRVVIPWSEIAAEAGCELTSGTQFPALVDLADGQWTRHDQQFIGTLPPEEARVLVDILRRFTTTASRCWFGVSSEFGWNGYDYPLGGVPFEAESTALSPDADGEGTDSEVDRVPYDKPVVQAPHRSFMLYPGAIDDALLLAERFEWAQVPNLWWPEDRAWCVRTDIDLDSTYIAGSDRLVDALIAEPGLEVLRATFDDEIARGL
jgi:hypothetical protein